ncbi:hypothetical protein AND_003386 [Anopheles darlingi]|uniref:Uncharacterized protein n=1 Tax=Anopheles darlingi TaxID=43151 RepID=W5JPQ2_ANODA|nr:hypothetical protein AND_003386 [Anopheles darlingi]
MKTHGTSNSVATVRGDREELVLPDICIQQCGDGRTDQLDADRSTRGICGERSRSAFDDGLRKRVSDGHVLLLLLLSPYQSAPFTVDPQIDAETFREDEALKLQKLQQRVGTKSPTACANGWHAGGVSVTTNNEGSEKHYLPRHRSLEGEPYRVPCNLRTCVSSGLARGLEGFGRGGDEGAPQHVPWKADPSVAPYVVIHLTRNVTRDLSATAGMLFQFIVASGGSDSINPFIRYWEPARFDRGQLDLAHQHHEQHRRRRRSINYEHGSSGYGPANVVRLNFRAHDRRRRSINYEHGSSGYGPANVVRLNFRAHDRNDRLGAYRATDVVPILVVRHVQNPIDNGVLSKEFRLVLREDPRSVFARDVEIENTEGPMDFDVSRIYTGTVEGLTKIPSASASASLPRSPEEVQKEEADNKDDVSSESDRLYEVQQLSKG